MVDSFIWSLILLSFNKNYFRNSQYWYYFNEVYFANDKKKITIEKINILKELSKAEIIIIFFANATTLDADNDFTEKVYELYFGKNR
ncbi:MAG: hypothetical protein ACTTJH_01705 [Bacteroidales bacterium]